MDQRDGFTCAACGQFHQELPFSYGAPAPDPCLAIPEHARARAVRLDRDLGVIDEDALLSGPRWAWQQVCRTGVNLLLWTRRQPRRESHQFFIKGNIELPVVDAGLEPRTFAWTVWVSLSRASFTRATARWEDPRRVEEPPYFGWLCTNLPPYPTTLLLKTHVHTRPPGLVPLIELEPTDHLLAVEQREGITLARVREIAALVLHPNSAPSTA